MTTTTAPQLALTRTFNAPRALVYQAFTDPHQFAAWWGPIGNSLPRDEIEFDVRPGGYQRWTEVLPADPGIRVRIRIDLTDVVDGELLDGTMRVGGQLPGITSRSRRGCDPSSTMRPMHGLDSRSASGSRSTWCRRLRTAGPRRSASSTLCSPAERGRRAQA